MKKTLALRGGLPVRSVPYPQHTTMIGEEEKREVMEVLESQHLSGFSGRPGDRFLGGPKVRELESYFANYFGVSHAVSLNSATSALHAAVSAAKVGPGDEVIVPPTTMSATSSAVLMQNAIPVFADIEDETFGLDPEAVTKALSQHTKAILTVNLFGHPSRLSELRSIADSRDIVLIEDNSQSPGAWCGGKRAGTIGEMGIQSLNYHKGIQTGEGGIVLTGHNNYAEHVRFVRNHGEVVIGKIGDVQGCDLINMLGWNYRLTELQAAVGIPQLSKLNTLNGIRIELAEALTKGLRRFDFITPPVVRHDCSHVYYLYPMRFHSERLGISRRLFAEALKVEGISIAEGYVQPLYLEPLFQKRIAYGDKGCPFSCSFYQGKISYKAGLCPKAERLFYEEFLITDICKYPNTLAEVAEFLEAVGKIADSVSELKRLER